MIKILDLSGENQQSFCEDLSEDTQRTLQGGFWLTDAFNWAVEHISVSFSNGLSIFYNGNF